MGEHLDPGCTKFVAETGLELDLCKGLFVVGHAHCGDSRRFAFGDVFGAFPVGSFVCQCFRKHSYYFSSVLGSNED